MTIERISWIWPSAMSSAMTPKTPPSESMNIAPGWPLTTVSRQLEAEAANALARPRPQRARDAVAAADRPRERRDLAAAVAVQDDVVGQQRLEAVEIAVASGLEEAVRELRALLLGRVEARALIGDLAPRARGELAGVADARADDLGHLVVAVVEHVVQQQRRALFGRQRFEDDEERQ